EAKITEHWPIDLNGSAHPARRLIDEAILVVSEPHGSQRAFGEVVNLLALRRNLAGYEVKLIISVEVDLEGFFAKLLALLQFLGNVRITRRGEEGREPVETGHHSILHLPRWDLSWPAEY